MAGRCSGNPEPRVGDSGNLIGQDRAGKVVSFGVGRLSGMQVKAKQDQLLPAISSPLPTLHTIYT